MWVGVGKREYALVVIADGNDTHVFVAVHEGVHQAARVCIHVLRFVYYDHGLADMALLHLTCFYHLGSLYHHAVHVVKIAYASEQLEAKRVERHDVDEVGGVADELHEPLLEFGSCSAREGEHEQLLVLHVFKQQQRGQLVHKHARLAASRSCGHYDAP